MILVLTVAVLLGLVVGAVFWQAQHGAFLLWDDDINIVTNTHLNQLDWANLHWMFTDVAYMRRYVPLTWLNWSVEHAMFGLSARSAHLGNVVLHIANTVGVFLLIRRMLSIWPATADDSEETPKLIASGTAALLWAIHPLRVEPVAWASGRIYCLATFFLLLCTLSYLEFALASPGSRRRQIYWWVALGSYVLSLLIYPLAVSFAAVLLVFDWKLLRRFDQPGHGSSTWMILCEKIVFLAIASLVATITIWARWHTQGYWQPPVSLADFGILSRISQAFYIWAYYVWKPFAPFNLSPVYLTLISFNPLSLPFVASFAGVVVPTAIAWWLRDRIPAIFLLWACHLAILAPMLGLTEHPHFSSDRYSYVAGIPWAVALAACVQAAWHHLARARIVVLLILAFALCVCGRMTIKQQNIWHNSETLFRYIVDRFGDSPYRYDPLMRLGEFLRVQGRLQEAVGYFQESLKLQPNNFYAHNQFAVSLEQLGRLQDAIAEYQRSVALAPKQPEVFRRIGALACQSGNFDGAVAALEKQIALVPADADAHANLANALLHLGRAAEAIGPLTRSLNVRPNNAPTLNNLGIAYLSLNRFAEAIEYFRAATRVAPDYAVAHANLGRTLLAVKNFAEAKTCLETALRLDPDNTEVRRVLDDIVRSQP